MDCEKFESTLLDELYDELDEVTSAAAKRHVGGCSRCASLLSGLKATRRIAVLPIVEPPADLEDRILAAAREAQKVVPLNRRASRAISWAGSWAMRPQTAMAALFLLTIGSGALLLKGKHAAPPSSMTVSEQGEPVASVTTEMLARPADNAIEKDKKGSASGFAQPPPAAAVAAAPSPAATAAASALASNDSRSEPAYRTDQSHADSLDGLLGRGRAAASPASPPPPPSRALKAAPKSALDDESALAGLAGDRDSAQNASNGSGAPLQHYAYAPGAGGGNAPAGPAAQAPAAAPMAPVAQAPAPVSAAAGGSQSAGQQAQGAASGTTSAMNAYAAKDYATAATLFDGLAANGDLTSALWAARSVRNGAGGCPQAAPRFDQVARAGAGTGAGYDATFEGGQCYQQMGQLDLAQARFRALITVPSYVDRAKNELAKMGTKSAAKAQAKPQQQQQAPAASKPADSY